jgi:hypothetical protein
LRPVDDLRPGRRRHRAADRLDGLHVLTLKELVRIKYAGSFLETAAKICGTYLLPRLVGFARATELLFEGRPVDASRLCGRVIERVLLLTVISTKVLAYQGTNILTSRR